MSLTNYKPAGYTSLSPYLVVRDAARTIDFLVQALGAVEIQRFLRPDGSVMHAELRLDDSVLMLGDPGKDWPAGASNVHLYVPDVDAAYQRALAAGAESVQEPVRKDDPDKRGGFKDPGGTTWWIATHQA